MNRYRFEAADATGKIESGHLEADSQAAAFTTLRGRGLTALSVHKESNVAQHGGGGLFSAKLSDNDLAWATRQLASLLGASLPLEAALSATVEQAEKKHIAHT
ncbi:type II secretion system protein GspF, partial [Pseudomonas sp. NPDC085632]